MVDGHYTRVHGTFDTSYPGANWRIDIPASAQTLGANVQYQLFTCNQSGRSMALPASTGPTPSPISTGTDCCTIPSIPAYRSPFGAQPEGSSVTLRFRTEHFNVTSVGARAYTS